MLPSITIEYHNGYGEPAVAFWSTYVTGAEFDAIVHAAEKIIGITPDI